MKTLFLTLAIFLISCSSDPTGKGPDPFSRDGVEVGNFTASNVPQTNAVVSHSRSWQASADGPTLRLTNQFESEITLSKKVLDEVSSPTVTALQKFLEDKFPERTYEIISVNNLEGVRANLLQKDLEVRSDIYFILDNNETLNIQTKLLSKESGIVEGEEIVNSTRLKYEGKAFKSERTRKVIIGSHPSNIRKNRSAYAFNGDCFVYDDPFSCQNYSGVAVSYGRDFSIGTSGASHGRVVELGEGLELYEFLKVEGEYLVAPRTKVELADIYTSFRPDSWNREQDSAKLKKNHVYLVRTVNWPDEDILTKMYVSEIQDRKWVELSYEKLVFIPQVQLSEKVERINEYTRKYEMPKTEGEVVLYNRSYWNNYFYASFNFKYGTSGNQHITFNSWDVRLEYSPERDLLSVKASGASGDLSAVFKHTGGKSLSDINISDFPDPNDHDKMSWRGVEVKSNEIYLSYHYTYNGERVLGALKVLDYDPEGRWARFKWRRVDVSPVTHFQDWEELSFENQTKSAVFEQTDNYLSLYFYPLEEKFGSDESARFDGEHFYVSFGGDETYLNSDDRPYGRDNGFFLLPKGTSLESIDLNRLEPLKGRYVRDTTIRQGRVYAYLHQTYFSKVALVLKVDRVQKDQLVQISYKNLFKGVAPYK